PEDSDRQSPYDVDVRSEGTFGLWLSVQGGSGLVDPPPSPGDPPHMLVEVDATPPAVEVDPPVVGAGKNGGQGKITWRTSDPHLPPRPVSLSYRAEGSDPNRPWTPIASALEVNGPYIWTVPANAPPRFRIRVEVADALGHRGFAESGTVLIDRSRPKGRII